MTKSNDIPIHPIPKIEMIWQADIRQLTKAISGLATALNKYGDVIGTTGDCGQLCAELVDGDECHHKRDERIRQQIRNNLGLK